LQHISALSFDSEVKCPNSQLRKLAVHRSSWIEVPASIMSATAVWWSPPQLLCICKSLGSIIRPGIAYPSTGGCGMKSGKTFLIIKPTRSTNFSNLFLEWNSTCFGQFLCPSSGVFHCTHRNSICHTGLLAACE